MTLLSCSQTAVLLSMITALTRPKLFVQSGAGLDAINRECGDIGKCRDGMPHRRCFLLLCALSLCKLASSFLMSFRFCLRSSDPTT